MKTYNSLTIAELLGKFIYPYDRESPIWELASRIARMIIIDDGEISIERTYIFSDDSKLLRVKKRTKYIIQ